MFGFNAGILTAQEKEGTFIEESGDAQDSTKTANILDYSKEFGEQSSKTGLIVAIAAAVLAGVAVMYLVRKKKKK